MLKSFLLIVIVLLCLATLAFVLQRYFIYFPHNNIPKVAKSSEFREVTIVTSDGLSLLSWYKKASSNHPTILYFHGNAGNIALRKDALKPLTSAGYGLLLLEYRGYGGNHGMPSENGFYKDARAALKFLATKGVKSTQVILFGESLGAGVATLIATEYPVCAVILQAPFTSLKDVRKHHYPWLPFELWDKYDSLSRIKSVNAPLLVLHGLNDEVVPFSQGEKLYNSAQNPKKMKAFLKSGHNNLQLHPEYIETIVSFTHKYCL